MGGFSQYGRAEEESSRWRPVVIAVIFILIIGAVIWYFGRRQTPAAPAAPPAYADNLQISGLHVSTAQNFVGAKVTYIEGTVANVGSKTVTGAEVEAVFRNSLGEIVDRQTQPLNVAASPLGHPDWVGLRMAPLVPNKTASFRLTFDHISADWNNGFPELRFVQVTTQ